MSTHEMIPLWPNGAPGALGSDLEDVPAISVHLPDPQTATGTAVVVCPGGGYRVLMADLEGLQVARWLNRHGIAAFVLRYRLGPRYHTEVSLLDGLRALRWVRARAQEFAVSPRRIGIMGFSAGGHMTCAVGTRWDRGDSSASDPLDSVSSRPDFLVPVYAVTNGAKRGRKADEYTATDELVDAETPPAFIVHTHEDSIVPSEQSILFYQAMVRSGLQSELHIMGYGEHGLGVGAGDPDGAQWTTLCYQWLRRTRLLTDAARVPLSGTVRVNGKAPGGVRVTCIPDNPLAPVATVKFTAEAGGAFSFPERDGPTAGAHTIEVHHITEVFPSNGKGEYSLEDTHCYRTRHNIEPGETLELSFPE